MGFFAKAYHTVMQDGSVPAVSRDAVKDVRDTVNQFFFGRGDHGVEPGSPLNPLFSDLAEDRQAHAAAIEAAPAAPSPADLVERNTPAAQQHDQQQRQGRGISM